ncbi:hypothetical protein JKL49_20735 [Phenylobacterium sp. 20VBR1]|uniref:Uncharacterized protein n=1 Tax=Phenylobacterium glaciei TaxID=2803784 RepID=A0A941D3W1_9CAUL|nr:hypothetical protein [Phenylobacterium glaciei]MBR7621830.1 hypothetical protein [Phenylobacterium glaciei]
MKVYPSTRAANQGAPAGLNDPRSTGRTPFTKPQAKTAMLPHGQRR